MDRFSLAERDRRWATVRALMHLAGIDILVSSDAGNSRYLAQVEAGPAVFPANGELTVFGARLPSPEEPWVRDARLVTDSWAGPVIERLRELEADGAIVGITGLDSLLNSPDGDLNYNTFGALREYLPHARWVGASALMRDARSIKSAEELVCLGEATRAAEAGLGAALLGPGRRGFDRDLWANALAATTLAGSDSPPSVTLELWPPDQAGDALGRPADRRFERGQVLTVRLRTHRMGYGVTVVQPAAVEPVVAEWAEAWRVHREAWERTWRLLRPGVHLEQLVRAAEATTTGQFRVEQHVEGAGLGDDLPLISRGVVRGPTLDGPVLREGDCFLLSPATIWSTDDGVERRLVWGDTIVVTARGARRLGSRPHELVVWDSAGEPESR